jgi:polar amino acid transport system permease protein
MAAMLGLSLNEGAYMSEIVRGGLLSVDPGQSDAAKALGYRPGSTFRVIILPQAMKAIVPPTGNQVIGMLKFTSLASIVALPELMHSVESICTRTFETIPLLIVAALWYLILVSVLSIGQYFIEARYSRGWKELNLPAQA